MFFNVKPRYNTNTSNIDTKKINFLQFDHEFYKKTYNDLQKENIVATQFHPEKSHSNGVTLLKNFAEQDIC